MFSLWIVYLILIALGDWLEIDSPIYTSIYSYFLVFVLVVTFFVLLMHRTYKSVDARFLWYTVFGVFVVSQVGSIMEVGASLSYFEMFFAVTLPCMFLKTIFTPINEKEKAIAFFIAFLLLVSTRLSYLVIHLLNSFNYIENPLSWLLEAIALNGGLVYFLNFNRLLESVSILDTTIENSEMWQEAVSAASTAALEGTSFLLLAAAACFAAVCAVKHRFYLANIKKETEEAQRRELETLEKERQDQERLEKERLEKAKRLIKSAKDGDTQAQYELGMLHLDANNFSIAVPLLQNASDSGDARSSYELGRLYCKGGEGFAPDLAKTYALLEKAAQADHADAQFLLGAMYYVAAGIDIPDYTKAAMWWGKAAANNHIEAMGRLAHLHTMGDEFPEADGHLAIKLFKKLAGEKILPMQDLPINIMYFNPVTQETDSEKSPDRASKRARADEIKAELYWLNKGIKEMEKFLKDFADDWDWRNNETQKKLHDDLAKVEELKTELEKLTKRKV